MFRNTFQSGFLSILYSIGSKPLQIWDSKVQNGHIKRITDQDIQSSVMEIMGTNVSTSYIVAPNNPKQTLGIKLPFLVMIIKNLNKYFTFEVQVLDDKVCTHLMSSSWYCPFFVYWLLLTFCSILGCQEKVPCFKLSILDSCKALHLHDAHAIGWRLESDPI